MRGTVMSRQLVTRSARPQRNLAGRESVASHSSRGELPGSENRRGKDVLRGRIAWAGLGFRYRRGMAMSGNVGLGVCDGPTKSISETSSGVLRQHT